MNSFKIGHSYNSGDLISILPGLQKLWQETGRKSTIMQRLNLPSFFYDGAPVATANEEGQGVCMNTYMYQKLRPLIEAQDYIESFEVWEGQQVDYNMDETRMARDVPMPAGEIHQWASAIFPELSCDLSVPWIKVFPISICKTDRGHVAVGDKVLVNRTERYTNPYITYFFLKEYEEQLIFAGSERERDVFNKTWKLNLPYLLVDDFLELARVYGSAHGFIGNQSFGFHICDGIKVNRILELCAQFPNTFITGANGHAFYRQNSLEYYVKEMMK